MQIIACQPDIAWEDPAATWARVRRMLEDALIRPGALIVLPEMFATGFTMHVGRIADVDGATQSFMAETAVAHQSYVLGGVVRLDASSTASEPRGRNEAVAYDPQGKEVARYCKIKPFTFGGEPKHYAAGDRITSFTCENFIVAPLICYDLRFPELFRRFMQPVSAGGDAAQGAHLFAVIANWPEARHAHWTALLRARAIENQAYVLGVNRTGSDPNLNYRGGSILFDPRGEVVTQLDDEPGVFTADIHLPELIAYRREFPALLDM